MSGPSESSPSKSWRLLNSDGTFNIHRRGIKAFRVGDSYHSLLRMSWGPFLGLVLLGYVGVNAIFGLGYFLCGPEALKGISSGSLGARYLDSFFFSVQTFATIGYGQMTPASVAANFLVALESLFGLLGFALATGLLFARFSRPTARVAFSHTALIYPIDGETSFVFRMANERHNQIVDAEVTVAMILTEFTSEGESFRNFYDLKLERARSPVFALSWTVVHPVTPDSPLHGMTLERLREVQAEIFVSLTGIDDTFSQTIHARYSYTPDELVWNHSFKDILSRREGRVVIDLPGLHSIEPIENP